MRLTAIVVLSGAALALALAVGCPCGRSVCARAVEVAPLKVGNTICPVCGNTLDPSRALSVECNGRCYNSCSLVCENEFRRDPERYAAHIDS